jgi:NADH-quinone oxidoreductase subunit J
LIAFVVLALVMIASALFTVTASKPVHSVVGLLVNFTALAATYLTLHAEFLAVIQIIVYSGAILVLFVFVIALLSSGVKPFDIGPDRAPGVPWPAVAFGLIGLGAVVAVAVHATYAPVQIPNQTGQPDVFGSVANFGEALFTTYLLPFEVTAFVLMVAIIGVVLLAGDDLPVRPARRTTQPIARSPREPIAR